MKIRSLTQTENFHHCIFQQHVLDGENPNGPIYINISDAVSTVCDKYKAIYPATNLEDRNPKTCVRS